jgi:putative hydrolase of the HAD superfamily
VTFDLWNTLLEEKDYTTQRVKYLAEVLRNLNQQRSIEEIAEAYMKVHWYLREVDKAQNHRFVPIEERLNLILKNLSACLTEDLKAEVIKEITEVATRDPPTLVQDAVKILSILGSKYRLGIISDSGLTPGSVLRRILLGHEILKLFDVTVFSDEVGYNKPHRAIFDRALKELGVQPSEAAHVGDLLHTDVSGAKNVGMKTIWLNRKGEVNNTPFKPDYEVQTLKDVVEAVKKLG